jgi:hypothetical protein
MALSALARLGWLGTLYLALRSLFQYFYGVRLASIQRYRDLDASEMAEYQSLASVLRLSEIMLLVTVIWLALAFLRERAHAKRSAVRLLLVGWVLPLVASARFLYAFLFLSGMPKWANSPDLAQSMLLSESMLAGALVWSAAALWVTRREATSSRV